MTVINKFPIPAFSVYNPEADFPCLITCEHASNYIPKAFDKLGLDDKILEEHIAWDPGAKQLSEYLANQFNCTAIFCQYSRLLIDCNRPIGVNSSILQKSAQFPIPGNSSLSDDEITLRIEHIFSPFHDCVDGHINRLKIQFELFPIIGIHSFTKNYKDEERPWKFSVMWKNETPFIKNIIKYFKAHPLAKDIGFNEPYSAKEIPAFTTEYHANRNQLPTLIFEVRQDLLIDPEGIEFWGNTIKEALNDAFMN